MESVNAKIESAEKTYLEGCQLIEAKAEQEKAELENSLVSELTSFIK